MEGPKWASTANDKDTIYLSLTDHRHLEATVESPRPDRVLTRFQPDGTYDGENLYTDLRSRAG